MDAMPDQHSPRQLAFDGLEIDPVGRQLEVEGRHVHLTTKEFDLLVHMAASPGRIFARDELLAHVWGFDHTGNGRTVDVHVSWLRSKLRGSDGHDHFRAVRGIGYAFSPRSTGSS